ncbi:ABC transporter substrate-binding protein [Myxosarcina sp. GI1]|uniref:ABC transporter substrate-binding protein n=1 Tax=Myxosarcina sp. GI1 TaxID=1541065 RepID=UPI00068E40CE|nr:ABC transporter substrate-binding protein [Myxosarcina sp. GI1]
MRKSLGCSLKKCCIYLAIACCLIVISCSNNLKSTQTSAVETADQIPTLNIWWEKGFNLEEDEALQTVVDDWEKLTGNQVNLSFFTASELATKVKRAVRANNTPCLMMSQTADRTLYPRLAWQGKLEDVSDIIEPVRDSYSENILKAATYYNSTLDRTSYYGVPVHQSTIFIFYWQQLLASVGLYQQNLPQDWDDFWQFWQQAQLKLKTRQDRTIYGLGLTFANRGTEDLYFFFEHILEAFNVTLINSQGELLVNRPKVRQGIIKALDWYTQLYKQGFVPPDTVNWLNTDNNLNLLNRIVLMTPNVTLSIPAAIRQDSDTYYNKLRISEFPHKPNGEPMRYIISVRQAVIFRNSPHVSLAKEFLQYLIQPEITAKYLQNSGNRNQPVQKQVWANPLWQQTSDPYLATATKILNQSPTRLFYVVDNPAYSQVLEENIWGKALNRIIIANISPQQAADEAIARIEQIFQEWK